MSTTQLINQTVAEQRHASESHQSRSPQRRGNSSSFGSSALQNVGESERTASLIGGAVLTGLGLTRGGLTGLLMLGLGGAIAYRGVTGHCSVYESMGINTTENS